jgi:hypothetical protein
MSSVAEKEEVPVSVPMSVLSVATLVVVQVAVTTDPKIVTGTVISAPEERTVPFVVLPIRSIRRLPALSTTTFSCVQTLKERVERGALGVPVKVVVVPAMVEARHVFPKVPAVSLRVIEPLSEAWIVTEPLWVTPFTSSVVADAVPADDMTASAAAAAMALQILMCFISCSSWSEPAAREVLGMARVAKCPRLVKKHCA